MKARKDRWSWYLYDVGNSAYAAVVLLAVYATYFKNNVVGGALGSWYWGLAVGIAMLVVAVLSPILGSIADFSGTKKRLLFIFTSMCVLFTGLLFFVSKGDVVTGMLFFILAEIGYRAGQVFYNSLLPDFTTSEDIGSVSGIGWAIGSIGGIVCLLIILPLIMLVKGEFVTRLSFVITAVYFAIATIPLFVNMKEKNVRQVLPAGSNYISVGFKRIWDTFQAVKTFKEFMKFIAAFLVYNAGIIIALDFAAIIGATLFGMTQQQLIILMIIVQITSVFGAYIFGILSSKVGFKITLISSLALMMIAIIWMILNFTTSFTAFYFIAGLAGFALTGVQSLSRGLVGTLAPQGKSAEFYGFFSVASLASAFIGPSIYGYLAAKAASWYEVHNEILLAEQYGQRAAMFSILGFLVIGLVMLLLVKIPKPTKKTPIDVKEIEEPEKEYA